MTTHKTQKKTKKSKPRTMFLIDGEGHQISYMIPYKAGASSFAMYTRGIMLKGLFVRLDTGEVINVSPKRNLYHATSFLTVEIEE